jgi:predicted PurR-regulated permease PerM
MGRIMTQERTGKEAGWLAAQNGQALVFIALAALVAWLCWQVVEPLAAPIAWALALAVVTHPVHAWLARRLKSPSLAAGLTTVLVMVVLVLPAALAGRRVAEEAVAVATRVQAAVKEGRWAAFLERNPRVAAAVSAVDGAVDMQEQLGKLSEHVPKVVQTVMSGTLQFAFGAGVALFLLFFFLRDRAQISAALRALLPLSEAEGKLMFRRVDDTIYAILYGTVAVCLVQGALGAFIFWWLDLHSPLLWGSAMAVLSVVPVVGTALVWGPAAVFLLLQGSPEKAIALAVWGFLVIGLIDNLLKPSIVKGRLSLHIVPVFVSILGGLAAFGAAGVIIGPVILSVAISLIGIRRARGDGIIASQEDRR